MACIKPPVLTDEQLLAFIDGEATADIVTHLQQCVSCGQRAKLLARQQNQLLAQLYRVECPSSLELGEYHIGLLAPERVVAVEQHLTHCLHCAREVQTVQNYLQTLAPSAKPVPAPAFTGQSLGQTLGQKLGKWVATLVDRLASDELEGGSLPAFASLRGDQEEQAVYKAGHVQIVIELQRDSSQPDHKLLLGLVLGIGADQTVEAYLEQAGQALGSAPVDELGNFVFEHLTAGLYTLILRSAENEIWIEAFQV